MSVESIIADARAFAALQLDNADAASQSARAALGAISDGGVYQATPVRIEPPLVIDPGVPPAYTGSHFERRTLTATRPSLTAIGSFAAPTAPGAVPTVATYTIPVTPVDRADPSLLADIPVTDDIDVPTAPNLYAEIQGIAKPDILAITIPTAPIYAAPEFTGSSPVFGETMPTHLDATMRTQYSTISPIMVNAVTSQIDIYIDHEFPNFRAGMAKIETRLNTYLDGGSALSAEVENAIYSRTLGKTNTDARRARDTAWKDAAKAGFTMPTVYLLAKRKEIDQDRRDNNARAATDIAVKQAELEQQNLQFAVTQSTVLRQLAITSALNYYSGLVQINGQALQYAREVVDAIVKAFDIAARYAEVQTRIYEAQANVYSAKLRGALAIFEAYTAQVRGLEAQANVNTAQVNAYRARLDAVQAEANVYRAQVDGAVAQANIEKIKVEVYQAKVQAYAAQVNADSAKWQGFAAACNGQAAKVQASAEQVRAFSAQVGAYEAQVRAKGVEIEAQAASNEQRTRSYVAETQAFSAQVTAEATAVSAEINSFEATLGSYKARAEVIAERSRSLIQAYSVALRSLIEQSQLQFQYLKEANDMRVAKATGMARISESLTNVHGSNAQAALAGMNTLASQATTS